MTQPSAQAHSGGLLKILGYGFGLAVVFGSTVGSGILRAPDRKSTRLNSSHQ